MKGIVTNIQRFSIHDGPGIRTTVFLKGCNLHCFWCHNPETLSPRPELQIFPDRCIGCGECFQRCPHGCHVMVDGAREFRRELCEGCGICAETCYAECLVLVGWVKTVEEVVEEVLRDRPFYETSKGGVTLSGGEPLLQRDFSYAILERCKAEGLHTAIETAANFPWERVASILPVTDLVMMDIKLMDSQKHRECTGVPNERILDNALHLGQQSQPLIIRTPVVPGVNDNPEEIRAIASFVAQLPNLLYYELLPFHPMARGKYNSLDLDYRAAELKTPSKETMDALTAAAEAVGVPARHG
ncbi:MAG: glycyl-radical enzyme activating protein [Anaerolineae bacterium]|nr:glycyl-radical enzyme activating protein [Anaerolineae bacterium]